MGKHDGLAITQVRLDILLVDLALDLVWDGEHDDIGGLDRLRIFHHLEAGCLGLLA